MPAHLFVTVAVGCDKSFLVPFLAFQFATSPSTCEEVSIKSDSLWCEMWRVLHADEKLSMFFFFFCILHFAFCIVVFFGLHLVSRCCFTPPVCACVGGFGGATCIVRFGTREVRRSIMLSLGLRSHLKAGSDRCQVASPLEKKVPTMGFARRIDRLRRVDRQNAQFNEGLRLHVWTQTNNKVSWSL